ncbi:MAG: avidin/streptavidin family protein [Usitatibacteraceae bacterium]
MRLMQHETALLLAGPATTANPPTLFGGRWINQMGSSMDLTINGASVTGVYTSASSAVGASVTGSIIGYVAEDVISFSVLWVASGSITSWVGQLVEDGGQPKLRTLWNLVTNVPDQNEPLKLWMSTFTGADEFHR